jgi:AcrR family transcriptional regulator
MLEAAEGLMREGGFKAAGIKQIAARGRAPIGSLYHHFPGGKTQLAIEALQLHGSKARTLIDAMFAGDQPLASRVRTLFRTAARQFDQSGCDRGCAIGAVTLDLASTDEALRRACNEAFSSWVEAIAHHLPWKRESTRRAFAEMVVTTVEGAFVVSRARKSGQPFLTAGEWLAAAAESYSEE